jgi:hypothetical protein
MDVLVDEELLLLEGLLEEFTSEEKTLEEFPLKNLDGYRW